MSADGWCRVCGKYKPSSDKPKNFGACNKCLRDCGGVRECATCGKSFVARKRNRWCGVQCSPDSVQSRFVILQRDEFRCIYCGVSSVEDGVKLHIDHITPAIKGGIGRAFNLVTACNRCNTHKQAKLLAKDILDRIFNLVDERNKKHNIDPQRLITTR